MNPIDTNGERKGDDDDPSVAKDSLISDKMYTRRRRKYSLMYYWDRIYRRDLRSLTVLCMMSFVFFIAALFLNGSYIVGIIFPQKPTEPQKFYTAHVTTSEPHIKYQLSTCDGNIVYKDFNYLDSSTLNYTRRIYSNDTEILFRLPTKVPTTALLLIFHGCSRSAHDWFHTIERQRIVGAAIDLGYGCLAFQATDKLRRCWSSQTDIDANPDAQMINKGLKRFYKDHPRLKSLPRFTFGASSGGVFSSIFATNQRYSISGQIIFIGIVHPEILETSVRANHYPPTAWIHMTGDVEFASESRINASMQVFFKERIPNINFPIQPVSLTAETFQSRIPTIRTDTSDYIFDRFKKNSWLNGHGELVHNPRQKDDWQTFLFEPMMWNGMTNKLILVNLESIRSLLPEFLNTLYGEHEISYERSYEALKWHSDIYNDGPSSISEYA